MPDLLFPFLVSVVLTLVVVLAALCAFVVFYRRAIQYAKKEARLPLATRWEDLSARVADLQEEWDRVRGEIHQGKLIIDEAAREREWLNQNKDEISKMRLEREQLERLRGDLVQAQEEYARLRQQLEETALAEKQAKFIWQQLEARSKTLEQQIDQRQKQIELDQTRQTALLSEIAEVEKRLRASQGQLADALESVKRAQGKLDAISQEIASLTKQRDDIKRQRDDVEQRLAATQKEMAKLQVQSAQRQQEVEELGSRLDSLRAEESKIRPHATSKQALSELWSPVINLSEYKSAAKQNSEARALDEVGHYLQALDLKFSKRVIHAFHTSLKVARDTPLLVLAGISGTGKSLLPRRYAEAMGIHFLGIPVQPRWDGPQDLLGFFNYLENRYKATELVRALIQFDPVKRKWIPDEYEEFADDRLLLVLLDEMNLSRVEYYFSEFLSRLETRRDIQDAQSEIDRVKAEIKLDVGRFGEESDCRIYADTNVLFVGTMNEDESTLTLSDKVIDRANVMRFGRPVSLSLDGKAGLKPALSHKAKGFLSKDIWNGWIEKAAKNPLGEAIEQSITHLNESLVQIGRPFGYRTRNAIRSYVQQYVDQSEDGIRMALADQIEQRVLPKLRGIDPAEDAVQRCIEGVKRVVEETDDKPLLAAIEQGESAQGGHLFTWFGVERTDD